MNPCSNTLIRLITLFLVVGSTLLSSCERVIDFPLPFEGERLVVLALFDPEEIMEVEVTRTAPAMADSVPWVTDAIVEVYEADTLLEVLSYAGRGKYLSALGSRPSPQASYQLRVYDQRGDSAISARVTFPEPPQLARIQALRAYYATEVDTAHLLRLKSADLGPEDRFYELSLRADAEGEIRLNINYTFYLDFEGDCNPDGGLFTQSCVGGSGWELNLPIPTTYPVPRQILGRPVDTVWVQLVAYDQATYNYYQAIRNPAGGFDQVFLPPDPLPNFMTGGYGILAMRQVRGWEVVVE